MQLKLQGYLTQTGRGVGPYNPCRFRGGAVFETVEHIVAERRAVQPLIDILVQKCEAHNVPVVGRSHLMPVVAGSVGPRELAVEAVRIIGRVSRVRGVSARAGTSSADSSGGSTVSAAS